MSLHLVSADYETRFTSVDHLAFPVPDDINSEELDLILGKGLREWAEEIGWDLVDCEDDVCMLSMCEGECVDGSTLISSKPHTNEELRSVVLGTTAVPFDEQSYIDAAASYFHKYEKEQMLYVVLNWDEISVYYVTSRGRESEKGSEGIVVREMNIDTSSIDDIVESSLSNLVSVSIRRDLLIDLASNMKEKKIVGASSPEVQDVLRAYVTAGLFSMKDAVLQTFGMEVEECALLITGDIARVLPESHTILSVVDGLQLRGRYEIAVDSENRAIPAAVSAKEKSFVFPLSSVFPRWYLYISTERGGGGRTGETAFRGMIRSAAQKGKEDDVLIVGQSGSIYTFGIPDEGKPGDVYIEPARSVYFPNLRVEKVDGRKYLNAQYRDYIRSVVIDCRKIPVVYGPDAESNHRRISEWVRGLPNI